MKGLGKRLLTLVLAVVLMLGSCMTVLSSNNGNTTLIKRSETVEGYEMVGPTSTASFKLHVKRLDDEFNMYRLTKVTWSKAADGVTDVVKVEWIDEVQEFIDNDATFSTATFLSSDKTTKKIYTTPENLGEAEDTTTAGVYQEDSKVNETYVINLLKAIREDDTLMAKLKANYVVGYHGDPYDSATVAPNEGNSTSEATVTANYQDTDFRYSYTIENMPVGLCFIDVASGARTYQPVLLDLMPVQVGPTGNWYVKKALEYSLKYEDAGISKKINGKAYDIVREGEIVSFEVQVEVPIYHKGEDSNYEFALFNIFDDMEQGFTLIPTSAQITIYDADNKAYQPTTNRSFLADGTVSVTDADTSTYAATMAEEAYVYYATTDDRNVFYATATSDATGKVKFWGEVDGKLVDLGSFTEDASGYAEVIKAYNNKLKDADANATTLTYTSAQIAKREHTKSLISVVMDYTRLMDTITVDTKHFTPDHIVITYDAIINDTFYVGSDENTNDAYLHYVGDSAGNKYISQAQVKAWTYAANLVKVDGDTVNAEQALDENGDPLYEADGVTPVYKDPTYLDGAIFDLYRLDATYCGGSTATSEPAESAYSGYTFLGDADEADYAASRTAWMNLLDKAVENYYNSSTDLDAAAKSTAITEAKNAIKTATGEYDKLDKCEEKYGAYTSYQNIFNKYVLPKVNGVDCKYVPVKVASCSKCGTEHYHVQVYITFWDDITSTNTAEGITVTGLDPNTYLLVETKAPGGYHELSTAMQFVINKYDDTQANSSGTLSYKGFIDEEDNDVSDGIYDIVVQNFKGLVLPSTGGMGTLLFTIIGIMIMAGAMIIIIVKGKKRKNTELY